MKQDNKTAAIYVRVSALDSRDVEGEDNRSHASTEVACIEGRAQHTATPFLRVWMRAW